MTTTKDAIITTLDRHNDIRFDGPKRQWQCICGVPLSDDMPRIGQRAHLVSELLATTMRPEVTTADELAALPDMTVVLTAAGTIANLVGDRAYFFGYDASVSRSVLALPATVLRPGATV